MNAPLAPGAVIGFVGLGNMGTPMARRLVEAGYTVRGFDTDPARHNGITVSTLDEVTAGADAILLMLPNSDVVEHVVYQEGLLEAVRRGTVLVDLGSSRPHSTRTLAERAAARGVPVVDAPVSGGVDGAEAGTLTVMAGGAAGDVERVRPVLERFGKVQHVGAVGAGHALKALNNLMSATHLLVSSEALLAGQEFGLDPAVMLDVVNGSSGRSGSTEAKWPKFVLPGTFDSGFGLRLMLKDMRIAVELARETGAPSLLGESAVELWAKAAEDLPPTADHTEIVRWLQASQHREERP
ncbi:NAD(P)-dependent oxidoreductase [Kibdelosporangium persicum]|uniref:Beta-hydroxyacid dehydrogenase, 3-hydroxyisobutyrate dehydrogenase n=1 Tax=Kibdelosporangium persicum TaxID=2698649 RepID=A0ABX2FCA8_9PSEU|nr:NAD(P)-dependent oxidoreductase [Kibdelosporangium persicum]NRN68774.1 Beta-hydroxyacid dehydrogenase, 3-hydroxyisobutyrate dehydrogenase [Kibdelosporangium persicum]